MAAKKCLICNCAFRGRSDAKTCSPRCRKRLQQVRFSLAHNERERGRMRKAVVLLVLGLFGFLSIILSASPAPKANAATNSFLNFQMRLLTNTGSIVPDGNYNIEFKVYDQANSTGSSQGSCTGDAHCLWTETRTGGNAVKTVNGYLSANLGSVTAFPTTIKWDQQMWLGVRIGGNVPATPVWEAIELTSDGTATGNKIQLTGVPYAFDAGAIATSSGANRGTLSFNTVANNPNITIPDVASGTLCIQSSSACGFESTTGTDFIQNQTASLQAANFRIQNASGSITSITGASGQTVDIFDVDTNGNANPVFGVNSAGNATFRASAASSTAFQIQNSSGLNILTADTSTANTNNLVANPSFETAVSNWSAVNGGSAGVQSAAQAYEGSKSLLIATNTTAGGGGSSYSTGAGYLSSTTTYTLSAFVKTDSNLPVSTFEIGRSDTGLLAGNTACLTGQTINQGWTRFTCTFTTGTTSGSPYIYFKVTDNVNRNLYIDDVLLQTDANAQNVYRNGSLSVSGALINSPIIIQGSSNSSNALQVNNSAGSQVLNVDTTDSNLISNSGFEVNVAGGAGTGWTAQGTNTTIRRDTTQSYTGAASLKVTQVTSTSANSGAQLNLNPIVTSASTTYTVSFYGRLDNSSAAFTDLMIRYSPDNTATSDCSAGAINTQTMVSTGWTRFVCQVSSATPPTTSGYIRIMSTGTTLHTYYIDGVQLETGSSVSAYADGQISLNGTITSPLVLNNKSSSVNALQVQNATGVGAIFNVDTLNNRVTIGDADNASSANSTLLVVDSGLTANRPTAVNGGIFYDTTLGHFVVVEGGSYKVLCNQTDAGCGAGGGSTTDLQGAYNNTASSPATITTTSSGKTLLFKAGGGFDATSLFAVQNAAGNNVLSVDTSSTAANNTVTLGKGSNLNGQLSFANSTNSNTITIRASNASDTNGAPAGSLTFKLPSADGISGQCLATDGTGDLAFNDCSGSSGGGAGNANRHLSNLTGVLVNASLTPGTDNSIDLDSAASRYVNEWLTGTLYTPAVDAQSSNGALGIGNTNAGAITVGNVTNTTVTVKTKSSGTAFQVQNASSKALLTVDSSANQVLLGTAGTGGIDGKITFNTDTASSFAVSIAGSSSTTASYTLTLPTALPGSSSCIQSSNTGVLSFVNCGAGATTTLAQAYTNGSASGDNVLALTTGTGRGGLLIQDSSGGIGSNLFAVQSNTGTTTYLGVTATTISAGLNLTFTQASPIISASSSNTTLKVQTNGTGTLSLNDLGTANTIQVGNTSGAVNGIINIGTNATSGATNTIHIGDASTSTQAVTIGSNNVAANLVTIETGSTGNLNIGNANSTHLINIGAGATGTNTTIIGTTNSTSATTIRGGVNGGSETLSLQVGSNGVIGIGNSAAATVNIGTGSFSDTIAIGNNTANTTVGLTSGGTGNINFTTNGSSAGTVVKSGTNSATAFQVQNSVAAPVLLVDTTSTDNAGAQVNYLTYPGFETGAFNNAAAGWNKVGAGTLAQNSSKQHTFNGLFSAQLGTTTSGDGMTTSSFTSTPPANSYIVSFYAKQTVGAALNGSQFTIQTTDSGTHSCTGQASVTLSSTGFQRIWCTVSPTANVTALQITQTGTTVSRTIFIDSVQMQPNDYDGGTNNITAPTAYQFGAVQIRGALTSPLVIANNGDSVAAFQVQATSGNQVFAVDTLNAQAVLGTAGAQTGKLVLSNSTNTNLVTISTATQTTQANVSITVPNDSNASDVFCLQNLGNCGSGATGGNFLVQAPNSNTSGTAGANVVLPTTAGINGLTVNSTNNATTGATAAIINQTLNVATASVDALQVNGANAANTIANGISFNQTGAGTTTNGILINRSAGILTNGLVFQGTIGTDIVGSSKGVNITAAGASIWQTTSGNLTLQATAASSQVTLDSGSTGTVSLGNTNATTIGIGGASGAATTIGGGNVAHTIHIGDAGTNTSQTITIGSATSVASNVTVSGGTGASAVLIQTGATGGAAGQITIGNTSGANTQTIAIGTNNTSGATNTVNIGNGGTAANAISIGSATAGSTFTAESGTATTTLFNGGTAHTIQFATGGAAQNVTIGSTNTSSQLTLQAGTNGASLQTGSVAAGTSGGVTIATGGATAATGSGNVSITTGNITTSGTAGNVTIDVGSGSSTGTPTINIGNSNAKAITIGNTAQSGSTQIIGGTGGSAISIQAGTGGTISVGSANGNTINIGGNVANTPVNITSGGTGSITLTTNSSATGTLVKTGTNSNIAFQVQNSNSTPVFNIDTTTTNLVTNPSFEPGTAGWATTGTAGGGLAIAQNTTASNNFNGSASLQVTTNSGAANTGATVSSFTASVTPGSYVLSFFAKGGATNGNFSTLSVTITGGSAPACTLNSTIVTTAGFQRYTCSFTTTTTNLTNINFLSSDAATQHIFYLDAVQLVASANDKSVYNQGGVQLQGIITSPVAVQTQSDSTNAFQIQNASGSSMFSVDTLNSAIYVGGTNVSHSIHIGDGGTSNVGSFPQTSVLDNFNRANGQLVSPWVGMNSSQMFINTNAAAAGTSAGRWQSRYEGIGPFTDSEAFATLAVFDDWQLVGVRVQQTTPTTGLNNGYYAQYGSGTFMITKTVSNADTTLASTSVTLSAGDKIGIRVVGNNITAYTFHSGAWTQQLSVTDSTFTSGYLGMEQGTANTSQTGRIDDFSGGSIGTTPQTIVIGSTNSGSSLALQAGTGNITLSSAASTIVKPTVDSTTAFQVQNASGSAILNVDSTNTKVAVTGDLNVGARYGNRLFSDNFESGNENLWNFTTNLAASGVVSTTVHDGKYAYEANPAGTSQNTELKTTIASNNTVYLRAWVNVTAQTTATTNLMGLVSTNAGVGWDVQRTTTNTICLYNENTSSIVGSCSAGFSASAWHLIEMRITIGSGTGTSQLWLDGTQVVNGTSQSNGTAPVGYIYVGDDNNDTTTQFFDDVSADTVSNGTASSLNVDDSFHVGGSSSFGGPVLIQGNNNLTASPQLLVAQAGTGDTTVQLQGTGGTFYAGIDSSNSSSFTINSLAAATNNAPAFVQKASTFNSASNTTIAQAFGSNPAPGDLLVATVTFGSASTSTSAFSCADTRGSSFTTVIVTDDTVGSQSTGICYAINTSAAASADTITATYQSAQTFRGIIISEYSGVASTSPVDTFTGASTQTATTGTDGASSGNMTTSINGDLIYGAVEDDNSSAIISAGTNFTQREYSNQLSAEDKLQGTSGSVAATWSFSQADRYMALAVAFKPSAGTLSDTYSNAIFTLSQNGDLKLKSKDNSSTALQIQNASGTNLLAADTTNMRISIGSIGTATGQLYVSGSLPSSAIFETNTNLSAVSDLVTQGRYTYVTSPGNNKLLVYDVSNPASTTAVNGAGTTVGSANSIVVQGHYVYTTSASNNLLYIYDITNPAAPTLVSSTATTTTPYGLTVSGKYAYVTGWTTPGILQIFDISNSASPVSISKVSTSDIKPVAVKIQGNYAYVAITGTTNGAIQSFNVSNPTNPVSLSTLTFSGGTVCTTGACGNNTMYIQGRYAYVAQLAANKVDVVDISNPSSLASTTTITTGTSPVSVFLQNKYLYVGLNAGTQVQVYDVSNLSSVGSVGNITTRNSPNAMYVQGRYLYAAVGASSYFQIFDLGGAYIQQLEAGGAEFGTLAVDSNAMFAGDANIQGSLSVGQNEQVQGALSVTPSADASSAFLIGDKKGSTIVNVNAIATGNLLADGNFEGTAVPSTVVSAYTTSDTLSSSTAAPVFGSRNLLDTTAATANRGIKFKYGLKPNTSYTFSIYANVASGSPGAFFALGRQDNIYNVGGAGTGGALSSTVTGNGSGGQNFTTNVSIGDQIYFADGQNAVITAIPTSTTLTVVPQLNEAAGLTYEIEKATDCTAVTPTTTMTRYTCSFTTGATTSANGGVYARYTSATTAFNFNFDGAQLEYGSIATNYGDPGTVLVNQVANPSAEGGITGWTARSVNGPTAASVSPSSDFALFGNSDIKFVTGAGNGNILNYNTPLSPNSIYTMSFWARKDAGSAASFNIGRSEKYYNTGTASQTTTTVTGSGTAWFTNGVVAGSTIVWGTSGDVDTITNTPANDASTLTVTQSRSEASQSYTIYINSDSPCTTNNTITATWTQYTCSFTTGSTTGPTSSIYLRQTDTTSDTVYIDGTTLVRGANALSFSAPAENIDVDSYQNNIALNSANSGEIQPWRLSANLTNGIHSNTPVCIVNNYVYLFDSSGVSQFAKINPDGELGSWTLLNSQGASLDSRGCVSYNGYIYTVGGSGASTQVSYAKPALDGQINAWYTNTNSLLTGAAFPGVSVMNGYLYVVGGQDNSGNALTATEYAKINADGSVGPFASGAALSQATTGAGVVAASNFLWAIGGQPTSTSSALTNVQCIGASSTTGATIGGWSACGTLPLGKTVYQVVVINGYIYAIGGQTGSTSTQTTNVSIGRIVNTGGVPTTSWTTSAYPLPNARSKGGITTFNGYIYYVAGNDGTNTSTKTVYYTSTARLSVSGSIDLVGSSNQDLTSGSEGSIATLAGSITAGNITGIGNLQIQGSGNVIGGLSVGNVLSVNGSLYQAGTIPQSAYVTSTGGSGSALKVLPRGAYAFTLQASGSSFITSYNIGNSVTPTAIDSTGVTANATDMDITGNYAFIVGGTQELDTVDISNPTNMPSQSILTGLTNPAGVVVVGRYAYVTNSNGNLSVIDIGQPTKPVVVGTLGVCTSPGLITYSLRFLYIACSNGVAVVDVKNPTSPSNLTGSPFALNGTSTAPTHAVEVGNRVYIVNNGTAPQLQIFNKVFSTNDTIQHVSHVTLAGAADNVAVQGRYAYVAESGSNKIEIVDISNTAAPVVIGSISTGSTPKRIAIQGRYLYVATSGTANFQIFDLGGAYIQQLEAGGAEFGSLSVDGQSLFAGDVSIQGALAVGQGLRVGGSSAIYSDGTGSIPLSIENTTTGINLLQVKDLNTNFGSAVTGGAFISRNSYFGDEFSVFKTTNCAPAATANTIGSVFARGDLQGGGGAITACAPNSTPQVANTGELSVSIVGGTTLGGTCKMWQPSNTTTNGIEEILATGIATASTKANCLEYLGGGTGAGQPYKPFAANSLPVATFKVKANGTALNAATNGANSEVIVGLSDLGAGQNGMPSNGIFFSNCTAYSTTAPTCPTTSTAWQGYVASGGALVGSIQSCSAAGNLDTSNYAYLRIEVRSNSDVHFFVDTNVSNGVVETECGTGVTSAGPGATALGITLAANINSNIAATTILDTDYMRVWQDDNIASTTDTSSADSLSTAPANGTQDVTTAPITPDPNQPDPNIAGSFFNFLGATSEDTVINGNLFVHGTIYADKIKANEIEGLSIFTDELASLQQKLALTTSTSGNPTSGGTTSTTIIETATTTLNLNDGLTVGGDANFHGNVFFYKLVTFVEKTVFNNDVTFAAHVNTAGQTPDNTLESAAGITTAPIDNPNATLATATIDGNDTSGQLTVNTGDTAASGKLITVKFKKPFDKAPRVFLTPINDQTANLKYYVQSTTDGFAIIVLDQLTSGQNLTFNYFVIQ